MALVRLEEFEAEWGKRYPAIGQAWRRAWEHVVPFFAFAPGIRKMIYTTNAVEALHRSLRKIIKTRGSFPNDDAALEAALSRHQERRFALAARRRMDCRHGPVRHSVRLAFSRISAMTKASISRLYPAARVWPISKLCKGGPPAAPACGGCGLDRARCPATVSHHGINDNVRLRCGTDN